ncbi:MAG TPA: hypothetical protein VFB56_10640, partial [Nitrospiraceae bacterium]|nr:hypothetical protein [Nitrospiraceae bacterium]
SISLMAKRFLIRFHRQNGIDTPTTTLQVCRHFGMCRNIGKIVDLMIEAQRLLSDAEHRENLPAMGWPV